MKLEFFPGCPSPVADFVDYSPGFAPAVCGSGVSPARAAKPRALRTSNMQRSTFMYRTKRVYERLQNVHSEVPAAAEKNKSKRFSAEINTQVVHPFLCLLAGVSTKKRN